MKEKNFLIIVTVLAMTVLVGCVSDIHPISAYEGSSLDADVPTYTLPVLRLGVGETIFRFEVTDNNNNVTAWDISTDETTVGAALYALGLISGDQTAFGIMVTTVTEITTDFNADGTWWAFLIDGEMSPAGVDGTYIEAGRTYAFEFRGQ